MEELGISFEAAAALVYIYPANRDPKGDDTPMVFKPIRKFVTTYLGDKIARLEESQRDKYAEGYWLITLIKNQKAQENRELEATWRTPRYKVPQSSFQYRVLVFIIKDLNSEIERLRKEGRVTSGGGASGGGASGGGASGGGASGGGASGGAGAAAPQKPRLRIPAAGYNGDPYLGGGYRKSKSQKRSKSRKSRKSRKSQKSRRRSRR